MSAQESTLDGVRRRAAEDPNARYQAFDTYPWPLDRKFIEQLSIALNNATSGVSLSEIALQVRIQWFEQKTQIRVDGEAYKQWLVQTKRPTPNIVSEQTVANEALSVPNPEDRKLAHLLVELGNPFGQVALQQTMSDVSVPSWQSAAPTAELYVKKDPTSTDPDKEPYPKKFEEIVEFLQTGKEIPGIRKIPDTVIKDPAITTHGRLAAPPKPWEIGRTPSADILGSSTQETGT